MTRRRVAPRWQTPLPEGVAGSWGPLVAAYAESVLRIRLDRWLRVALNRALVYGDDGLLLHHLYLISCGRQQGKTVGVRALVGTALTDPSGPAWERIIGLAHDKGQARIPYEAVLGDLAPLAIRYGRARLHLTRYLGIRSDLFGRHREYHVGSREAADQVRSTSNDLAVFDEIRTQRDHAVWAALEPTFTARPDPLTFAISTAGDDRSVLLREWWERGIRIIEGIEPPGRFGMTWYAADDGRAPDDPTAWRQANPAVAEGRIPIDRIRESYLEHLDRPVVFRNERLNLWTEGVDEWLPAGTWRTRTAPQPAPAGSPRTILAIEAAPSWRRATVAVAFAHGEGAWIGVAGELDAVRMLRPSVAPKDAIALLDRMADQWRPAAVAVVGTSAIAQHVEAWAKGRDVELLSLTGTHLRAASQLFRSELVGGRLLHGDDPLLSLQARQARPSGPIESGDWYLSVRESVGDVDAIRAAAWAAWAVIAPEARVPGHGIHV